MSEASRLPADQPARERAIRNTQRHQLLGAGAGSGKTDVFVKHYLHLLEAGNLKPQQIVAVTFTNKATWEMKKRLREACREREAEAVGDERGRWRSRGWELEAAPIDTIHGLCSRILRESALAARLDPAFTVLEQAEADLLLEESVQQTLLRRLEDNQDSAARLVLALRFSGACKAIVGLVHHRAKMERVLEEVEGNDHVDPEALLARWQVCARETQEALLRQLLEGADWRADTSVLRDHEAADPGDALETRRREALPCITAAGASYAAGDLDGAVAALVELSRLRAPGKAGKGANWRGGDEEVARVRDALTRLVKSDASTVKSIHEIAEAVPRPEDADCAALTCALVHETRAALADYQEAKRRRAGLDFEDLLLQVRDLWEASPETLRRYQGRFGHVMVDEFQDTNKLQKDVLWRLIEGGAKLFVVGDPKQSIYRFRDADVTVFNRVQGDFRRDGEGCDELSVTFRATPPLVAFFNELFSHPALMGQQPTALYQASYQWLEAHREAGPDAPAMELLLVEGPPKGRSEASDSDEDEGPAAAPRFLEATRLAKRIHALREEQRQVWDKDTGWRDMRYGDVAILFHATTDLALYERALREAEVPYYVVSGRGFFRCQEVRDLVNCLRALENNLDEVALVGALRSPLFALSDETLFWLSRAPAAPAEPATWWDRLQQAGSEEAADAPSLAHVSEAQRRQVRFAARCLRELREVKNRLGLAELIGEILRRTDFPAALAAQQYGGPQMVSNLRKLQDLAASFEQGGSFSVRGFIELLKDLEVAQEREGQAPVEEEAGNVVKLMTVHQAKGLEWPVVFVPDLARRPPPDRGDWRWHRELGLVACEPGDAGKRPWPAAGVEIARRDDLEEEAERRRTFYVAATRARDLLVLSASYSPGKDGWTAGLRNGPLGWLDEALAGKLSGAEPGVVELAGEGWRGTLELVPADQAPASAPGSSAAPGLVEALRADVLTAPEGVCGADPQAVEALLRRVSPIEPDYSAARRFTATELAEYLLCPRRYELQRLMGLPSDPPAPPSLDDADRLSPAELGEVVHHLLRLVGTGGREALDKALLQSAGMPLGVELRAGRELARVRGMVAGFVASDLYQALMPGARRLRTEMTVAFEAAGAILEGKVDALVEAADGTLHLLDYKTGRPGSGADEGYQFQVGLYCEGVARARGRPVTGAHLVYLAQDGARAHAVDPEAAAREALLQAGQAVAGIRAGDFPSREGYCPGCPMVWACGRGGREPGSAS